MSKVSKVNTKVRKGMQAPQRLGSELCEHMAQFRVRTPHMPTAAKGEARRIAASAFMFRAQLSCMALCSMRLLRIGKVQNRAYLQEPRATREQIGRARG